MACTSSADDPDIAKRTEVAQCAVELVVLGIGQDASIPQIGNHADPAWANSDQAQTATALALLDRVNGARYLFEATPDISAQLYALDEIMPAEPIGRTLGLSGIFLTHAHIGHYAGLMFLGREAASTDAVPVYAMPRMESYIQSNGPWSQLVTLNNIALQSLHDQQSTDLSDRISVTPYRVPHRDEFSETVGFHIQTPERSALFLPDIDSWQEWETEHGQKIEDWVAKVDYAFVDATFFDDHELPGRDMSQIPHPRVSETMARFAGASDEVKSRIRFIHINHTNSIRDADSAKSQSVREAGFGIARAGERYCLI